MSEPNTICYKASNKTDIANAYNIRLETLKKWLTPITDELGEYLGRSYTPRQISIIVNHLGQPQNINLIKCRKNMIKS